MGDFQPKYRVYDQEGNEVAGDVFVLRDQDVFGASVLWSYAHTVQTALELDALQGVFTAEQRARFTQLARDLANRAQMWQRTESKIPD